MNRYLARLACCAVVGAALLAVPASASAQKSVRCDPIDPSFCLYPWPNDYFTKRDRSTDTDRRLALTRAMMPRTKNGASVDPSPLNRNDGFSPGNVLIAHVPGLNSTRALRRSGAVRVTDLKQAFAKNAPVMVLNARTMKRHLVFTEIDSQAERRRNRNLLIRPAVNFEEGERYIVVLRNLKNARGRELTPPRAFRTLRDGDDTRSRALERRRRSLDRILDRIERRTTIDRDDVYLTWEFTVASEENLSERVLTMRNDAFAQLGDRNLADMRIEGNAPAFSVTGVTNFTPCGTNGCQSGQSDTIARRVEGTFNVPCYLDQPGCPPGAQMNFASRTSNRPVQQSGNVAQPNFVCNIPYSAAAAASRPALFGHGLLESRAAIDDDTPVLSNRFNITFCAIDWAGMSTEDLGFIGQILFDASKFPGLPDRIQQGLVNFLYLGRLMMHPAGLPSNSAFKFAGQPALDTSGELSFYGNSQGGILGGALTALAPDYRRAVLGVTGMNYGMLVERSVDFDRYAEVLYDTYPSELQRPLLLSLVQLLWDRGDANAYAHHMTHDPLPGTPEHKALLVAAFGDHQVSNLTAEIEARTIGARLRKPALDAGRHPDRRPFYRLRGIPRFPFDGSALVYVDSGPTRTVNGQTVGNPPFPIGNTPPRGGTDPHDSPRHEPQIHQMMSDFMRPNGAVTNTCGSAPCYADGWTGSP